MKDFTHFFGAGGSVPDEFKMAFNHFLKTNEVTTFHQDDFRIIIFKDEEK